MLTRLTPKREQEFRDSRVLWSTSVIRELLGEVDALRAELTTAEKQLKARVAALEQALKHVIDASPGTPESVKKYLRRALRGEQPKEPGEANTHKGAEAPEQPLVGAAPVAVPSPGPPCPVCDQNRNTTLTASWNDAGEPIWVCTAGCYFTGPRDAQA